MKTTPLPIVGSRLNLFGQRADRMRVTMIGMLLAATALSLTAQPTLSSAGGLVGHWNFDEGGGPVAADSSGFGNDGQLVDGPSWSRQSWSPPQCALLFDGVDDHVNVGNSPSLNPSDEITLAARVAPYDLSVSGEIIAKSNGTDPQYYLRVQAGGKIRFGIGATVLNGNTTLSPSQGYHLAGTYDGSTMKIYVDGVLDAVMNRNGPMHDNGVDVWIGARHFRTPLAFNGRIDDARIFSRGLSATEIQSLVTPPGQVVITSPPNGQTVVWYLHDPPPVVGLTADVSNFIAPVTKVDFYDMGLVGTATEPPYSVVDQNTGIGPHDQIVAVATDTLGNTVGSAPISIYICFHDDFRRPDYVRIVSPRSGSVFTYGDPIHISIDIRDVCATWSGDGIELSAYSLGTYLESFHVHLDSWVDFVWLNAPIGTYGILAVDTRFDNYRDVVYITVFASLSPTVAITSPADGALFSVGAGIPVHVTAQDPDGVVVEIQLTDGTTTFTSTATDFDYTFPALAAGNYTLTATATDDTGLTASSSIQVSVVISRPANDDFANSFDLAQITTGNNANAAMEPGEPDHNPNGRPLAGRSVWWHWTAPSDGEVVLSTLGSSFDTVLAVYTGSTVDQLFPVVNNDNSYTWDCTNAWSRVRLDARAGTTYHLAVDGVAGEWGDVQLSVNYAVPPTVNLIHPHDGDTIPFGTSIDLEATASDSDGFVAQVYFIIDDFDLIRLSLVDDTSPYLITWTPPQPGRYHISAFAVDDEGLQNSDQPSLHAVVNVIGPAPTVSIVSPVNGTVFVAPASIPVHVTATGSTPAGMVVTLTDGVTTFTTGAERDFAYTFPPHGVGDYVLTATATDTTGQTAATSIAVKVVDNSARPPNDDFINSFDLNQITTANNVYATLESGEPDQNTGRAGHSVWWHWTPTNWNTLFVIDTQGSSFDAIVNVYRGRSPDSVDSVDQLGLWPNECGYYEGSKYHFFPVTPWTFYIAVDGAAPGEWGDIQLNAHYNIRPTVNLIRPHDGDTFPVGTPITVEATASDSDGFITQVQFFDGSIFAGGANPYLVTWTPSAPGVYWIYVRAFDNDCREGWSNQAYINVIE